MPGCVWAIYENLPERSTANITVTKASAAFRPLRGANPTFWASSFGRWNDLLNKIVMFADVRGLSFNVMSRKEHVSTVSNGRSDAQWLRRKW